MNNFSRFFRGVYIRFCQIDWEKYRWSNLDKTKLLAPLRCFAHPVDMFNDIKYEKRGSFGIANMLLALYFLEEIINFFAVAYLFSNNEAQSFSIWSILLRTVVLVLLWCIANWSMSTLQEGKGNFKEIYLAACYSLTPLVLFSVPLNLITNVMTLSESMFYSAISTVLTIWSLLLVFLGTMVIHQFTVRKTLGSVLLSLGMIVIVAFLVLLGFSVSQQMISFAETIITELLRR